MTRIGVIYSNTYSLHRPPGEHPEHPRRLEIIYEALRRSPLWSLVYPLEPYVATIEELSVVHDLRYIESLRDLCAKGGGWLDLDTYLCQESFEVARLAAGGALRAARAVVKEGLKYTFALIRPPGHHASKVRAGGFCLLNNIAIAARDSLAKGYARRIAILDWDVHHGNGTQEIFYDDPSVLYISLHEWGIYPGTGWYTEVGEDEGEGYNVNIPLFPNIADDMYLRAYDIAISILKEYKPELLLISCGFDAHMNDPLAHLNLSSSIFWKLCKILVEEIKEVRGISLILEGGYDLNALAESSLNVIKGLLNVDIVERYSMTRSSLRSTFSSFLNEVKGFLRRYWDL
ncbi:MAG: histone deacetylase [Thermoprotei archaeon]|nr:histone deacetylase [Thermoprotei archaeon]